MNILNERPEDMNFEEYKAKLKFQKAWIKNHKQGRLFYLASEILYVPEDTFKKFGYPKTYVGFVGRTKDLKFPI